MFMLDTLVIFGATYLIAAPPVVLGAYFFWVSGERKKELALLAALALPLAYVLARIAGFFYSHPQPFVEWGGEPLVPHAIDNAFPSDHVLLAAGVAAAVGFFSRPLGLTLLLVAAFIGLARVVAGLHDWSDIAASLALAYGAVWATHALLARRARSAD